MVKKNENENDDGIKKYFKYFKDTCDLKSQEKTRASTMDEKINDILKIKKSNLEKFEENFYNLEVNFK